MGLIRKIDLATEPTLGLINHIPGPDSHTMPPSKSKKTKTLSIKSAIKDLYQKAINVITKRKSEQAKEPKAALKAPTKPYRVVELFAGVGGFRIGLESVLKGKAFNGVWSNQYEPGSAKQWASRVYEYAFRNDKGSKHSNKLIEDAIVSENENMPPSPRRTIY